jgi:hypothetical protein
MAIYPVAPGRNDYTKREKPKVEAMSKERVAELVKLHKLHVPTGIIYDRFPNKYWAQLIEFEKSIWPFMVFDCRFDPNPASDFFEAITVDTKTFHCILGGRWDLDLRSGFNVYSEKVWAQRAAEELRREYRKEYKLDSGRADGKRKDG